TGPEASVALAKQGVFSEWPAVRQEAAAALKGRRLDDFVPPLISLLSTPASGKFGWYHDMARGVVYLRYVVAIETETQFQVATLQVVTQIIDSQSGLTPNPQRIRRAGLADAADDSNLARAGADVLRTLDERLRPREAARAAANERIAELNRRIGDV